jgi:hypothetical protein
MDWRFIYIIEKLLEPRCLKWAHMTHLDTWNTSYGQKKGRESNCQFDSRPLKVRNRHDFLAFRWRAIDLWKALDKGYNFALDLISIGGLQRELWAPKAVGVPSLGISRLPLGQNAIWMWALWRGIEYTIRGKVVPSPKSGPWWVLWIRVCPWLILAPKVLKLCTNQLIIWFVQIRVINWCLSLFLVPIPELQHAPLLSKCYEARSVPQLLVLSLFSP